MEGRNTLPEKDVIAPNQKSWPETANRMGARKNPRPQGLPGEHRLTERSIGAVRNLLLVPSRVRRGGLKAT